MISKSTLFNRILIVLAILVIANILLSKFFLRLDFTADKQYTLSNATKSILSEIENPVTVSAYFSANLPPDLNKVKTDFEDLLVEYANRSGNKVVYEFINPNENDEKEAQTQQAGIKPMVVNVRERDQMKQQRAYMGAKLQYGDKSEVIPFIQPGAGMEYALSSSIKKIAISNKPKIGFVSGHGEANLSAMKQAADNLSILYNTEQTKLSDSTLNKYQALAVIAPSDSFAPSDLQLLDKFLAQGKGIFFALNPVVANLQAGNAEAKPTQIEAWLATKGVQINADLVTDAKCGNVSVQEQQAFFSFQRQIPFPFLPLISTFAKHPITNGLEQIILPFCSSISFVQNNAKVQFTPLAFTSQKSGREIPPITFNVQKQWTDQDFTAQKITVAAAVEGELSNETPSKIVVIGDAEFAINGEGQQTQQLADDNLSLLANSIDWLTNQTGLNELRTKAITSRPIKKELSDSQKQLVKFGNFLAPLLLITVYGIFRRIRRKQQRKQWEQERYA